MKRVITVGTSFCGSTLLDLLLERAAKEVTSVGEVHHAHDAKKHPRCYPCVKQKIFDCPLDKAVRSYRADDNKGPGDLYAHVVRELNIDVLHTSDKASCFISRHTDTTEAHLIVLFKHPIRAMASQRRHFPEFHLPLYLNNWDIMYGRGYAMVGKHKVYIRYEDLCDHTAQVLQYICDEFGLTYDPTWVDTWNRIEGRHRIGGNSMAIMGTQLLGRPIQRDDTYINLLTDEEKDMAEYVASLETHQRLIAHAFKPS